MQQPSSCFLMQQSFFLFSSFLRFMAYPMACSQSRCRIGATAASLCHSHSNTATQDPSRILDLHHSSWQLGILNPLNEARDRTHILMDSTHSLTNEPWREPHSYLSITEYFRKIPLLPILSLFPLIPLYFQCSVSFVFHTVSFHFSDSNGPWISISN